MTEYNKEFVKQFFARERLWAVIVLLILILIITLFMKKFVIFLLICLVTGILDYIFARYNIPIDFTPVFFFSVLIVAYFGIWQLVIYILLAEIIPTFMGGDAITPLAIPYYIFMLFTGLMIKSYFISSFVIAGVIFSVIYVFYCAVLAKLWGEFDFLGVMSIIIEFLSNIVYFTTLAHLLIPLLA